MPSGITVYLLDFIVLVLVKRPSVDYSELYKTKNAQLPTCSTNDLSGFSMSFELSNSSGCFPLKYGQWPDSINESIMAEGPFPR